MAKTETKILENYVLGILVFSLEIAGIIYLFNKEWFIGIFLIVMGFLMTSIVMSLKHNRTKSMKELSEGNAFNENDKRNELTTEEADEIGRGINQAAYILGITAAVLFFHYDFKWYFAIPIGLVIGAILPPLLLGLGMLIKK